MAAPDDWLGQIVTMNLIDSLGTMSGVLTEVSDRGIVIRISVFPGDPDHELAQQWEPQLSFHPWGSIKTIQISESWVTEQPESPAP